MCCRSRFGKAYSQKDHVIYDTRFVNSWELPVEQMDVGITRHEISNHLGNVLAFITARSVGVNSNAINGMIENFEPSLANIIDFCPFGILIQAQNRKSEVYPSGFNGKENDNEIKGVGNSLDFGARMYDSRVGRFLSIDPLSNEIPYYTPFQYAGNKPIACIDLDGLEDVYYDKAFTSKYGQTSIMLMLNASGIKRDLERQFAQGNSKFDLYIVTNYDASISNGLFRDYTGNIVEGSNISGQTYNGGKLNERQKRALEDRGLDVSKTIKSGKTAIIVQISSDFGDTYARERFKTNGDDDLGFESLKTGLETITHEVINHAIDFISGKDNDSYGRESHRRFYGKDYTESMDWFATSPPYSDIKDENSSAGKYKAKIEKTINKFRKALNDQKRTNNEKSK